MKTAVLVLAGVLVALVAAFTLRWALGDDNTQEWLLSHDASSGALVDNGDGTFSLTMSGINNHVIGFTERPARDTVFLTPGLLVETWDDMFSDSAPNAVLAEHKPTGETNSVVMVLGKPTLQGDSISYEVEILLDEQRPANLKWVGDIAYRQPPETFDGATLFIDYLHLHDSTSDEIKMIYGC
jgi:hypothetical protein